MYNFNLLKPASFDIVAIFSNIGSQWYFYFIAIIIVALTVGFALLFKPQEKLKFKKTTQLAVIAMLSALCVIGNIFLFGPQNFKFSFVSVVCFIAGYILGPVGGLCVSFMGDLIAGIIYPLGVYNPLIALGSSLFGYIPGVIFGYFKGNEYVKALISYIICYIICSVILNSVATYLMYFTNSTKYDTLWAYLAVRIPPTFIAQAINLFITFLLINPLKRIKDIIKKNAL